MIRSFLPCCSLITADDRSERRADVVLVSIASVVDARPLPGLLPAVAGSTHQEQVTGRWDTTDVEGRTVHGKFQFLYNLTFRPGLAPIP